MGKKGFGKFLAGAAVGVGLGMLFAPKSGEDTRKELKEKFDELIEQIKGIKPEDVKDYFEVKVEEIKKDLAELDKEKVLDIVKERGELIKDKVEELSIQAKEKATPAVEKTINDIKTKLASLLKDTAKKIEKGEKTPKIEQPKKDNKHK